MRGPDRPRALLGLAVGAAALIAAGGFWATELRQSYRPIDLAYSESPEVFGAWLSQSWLAGPEPAELAAATSGRLLATPIASRRRLAAAMTDESFWNSTAAGAASRWALQHTVREAVLRALAKSPAAGDLWLAAAALHTRLDGFDQRAAAYLAASYRFAPREGQVAYARAGLIAHFLPVLDAELAAAARRDLALIEATFPRLHRAIAPALAAMEARR